ncbi:aldo/keto reductase [Bombilactobacillus folatiphilus]|uniref:Aldo/keto reductase n=1 Tax=Bombilactobacillus folatiphilus TaxID=2923362 RepID=A0ABY4PBB1_9LACO|nr:aldo/keto reductase [Bombilactobacillus folatiphilus]
MPDLKLNNHETIPQLGMGVFQMKDKQAFMDAVNWALEIGYRHFDTAAIYGNEKWLGEALEKSGIDRSEFFITSKLWPGNFDDPIQAYHDSCARLQLDYLDLYLIHWPSPGYDKAWQALEKLYAHQEVKTIGVSNFLETHLERIFQTGQVVPAVDQIELHPYFQRPELVDYLNDHQIKVEAWGPLGQGKTGVFDEPLLKQLATKYNKSVAQIILRWHLQEGHIIFPKSIHQQRLQDNFNLFDFHLRNEEIEQIENLDQDQPNGSTSTNQNFLNGLLETKPQN